MTGTVITAPISIGVLGAARIADRAIVRPARVTGHRLVAVAARNRCRAEDFAQQHGVERALGTYADVLADTDVEAIYNPLANALHGPWNLAAIRAGKHVLSEKPSTTSTTRSRAGSTNCWTAANSASFEPSRSTCSCLHPLTVTRAGPTNSPAAS